MIRATLALGNAPLRDRLRKLLPEQDVLVSCQELAALALPEREGADLIFVGSSDLAGVWGDTIAQLRGLPEQPEVIALQESEDSREIARLQAAGCFAIIPASLADSALRQTLITLVDRRREAMNSRLSTAPATPLLYFRDLISHSPATQKILRLATRVAASDTSLLILGETGVGKEWLARAIHAESPRVESPFIAVNCGAVPENLLESELFGHEKGAFTGAHRPRRGYFELAHRGTLFLDEVGEMPHHLQVKLLRALQDRTIQRLGSEALVEVDARIIAATNRDLIAALKAGEFRQDLYYRLAVVTLTLPPLRDRPEDIPSLVETYLHRFVRKLNRPEIQGVTPEAMVTLKAYAWPGNVRELINVVERAVLLCEGDQLDLSDLPEEISRTSSTPQPEPSSVEPAPAIVEAWLDQPLEVGRQAMIDAFERRYLQRLLERNRGNVGQTAKDAGVDPRTLYNKMLALGLRKEDFKS